MDNTAAVAAFASLSQETRLSALRVLVEHGRSGLAAGMLAERLGVPHNTLSFHLAQLERAGLISATRNGRQIIYAAELDVVQSLAQFLLQNCCVRDATAAECCPPKVKGVCS